jgi:GDPmannose 4,6-dehydratase
VADICAVAFSHLGLEWRDHVETSDTFYRDEEEIPLVGCAAKVKREVGWRPETSFQEMVCKMVEADLARLKSGR